MSSREIKFRAWDRITNKMIGEGFHVIGEITMFGCIDVYANQNPMSKEGYDSALEYDLARYDQFELMQWTGLKDIHKKDIYEGDILYCHEYDSSDCGNRIVQTFKNAVVGFGQGNFYYYPKGNMRQAHQLLMYAYKPEIIGNVFENPELL